MMEDSKIELMNDFNKMIYNKLNFYNKNIVFIFIIYFCNIVIGFIWYSVPIYFNSDKNDNFDSISKQYDLKTKNIKLLGIIKMMIPLLSALFCLIFSFLVEFIGIKNTFLFSFILNIICTGIMFFKSGLFIDTVCYIFLWSAAYIFFSYSAVYLSEISIKKKKNIAFSYVAYSLGGLLMFSIFYKHFPYIYINWLIFIFSIISLVLIFFIPDIPDYYLVKKKKTKFLNCFIDLAKDIKLKNELKVIIINYFEKYHYYKDELTVLDSGNWFDNKINNSKKSPLNIMFSNITIFNRIIIMVVFFSNIDVIIGITFFATENLGKSNFCLNGIVICFMEIIGYLLNYIFNKKLNINKYIEVNSIIIFILGIVLLILGIFKLEIPSLEIFISGLIKLVCVGIVTSFFVLLAEKFPMKVKFLSIGLILFLARSAQITCEWIKSTSERLQIHPLTIPCLLLLVSTIIFKFLK